MDTSLNNEIEVYESSGDEATNGDMRTEEYLDKSKIPNGRWSYTAAVILGILLYAIISVSSYMPIRNYSLPDENNINEYISSYEFIRGLSGLTRALDQSRLGETSWYNSRYADVKSVQFYITDAAGNRIGSNIPDATEATVEQLRKDSQFYLYITFDGNGKPFLSSSLGDVFNRRFLDSMNINDQNQKEYANIKIAYLVPPNFSTYEDFFAHDVRRFCVINDYGMLILIIGAVSMLILLLITLMVPYSLQRKISANSFYNRMYLEFKVLLWAAFLYASIWGIVILDDYGYYGNNGFNLSDIIYHGNATFYIIGIPITFILFLMTYLSVSYLKYAYHEGFKEGVLKRSIFGKILLLVLKRTKALVLAAIKVDIREEVYKKLVLLLGINFVLLLMIAITGPLGILLAIAYTVFLFKYLLKTSEQLKELHEASSNLATGNFEITADEEHGILSPIFKELNKIKEGFKLAIEKEVKSQHMKTELISNVSHDLRTPLTSIITYVDLLKEEDITEEARQEYINILDQKSKRLKVLLEDLFEASKASSGNIELHIEKVDVISLLRQTLGELEEVIKGSGLQIKVKAPEGEIFCELDGRRTYRVFENIMSNIFKYSMPNSRVYIDVIENQTSVSLIFKNISNYEMNFDGQEITERFTRGDRSRSTEGSGLGLAIAKSLVELQDGSIDVSVDGDLFKVAITFKTMS
ncbi:sensor histidine kinase [Brassicibacter mesophilus]|uniref:sensor histidine kinase n=1 Tax=Brassicibacter mesophilus TaxID=745119 RepID=UPI003D23EF8E